MKKAVLVGAVAALVVGLGGAGVTYAATAAAPGPKVIGQCANTKNGGYTRTLEAGNLAKSQFGACRKGEAKVRLVTVDGLPKLPSELVFQRVDGTETCTKDKAASTSTAWVFGCVTVAASPSPSASPPASPSPQPSAN